MTTILDHNESMTIYYSKATGIIRCVSGGIQDMSIYGDSQTDMELIQDHLIIPRDEDVLNSYNKYKVDLEALVVKKVITDEAEERITALEAEVVALRAVIEGR